MDKGTIMSNFKWDARKAKKNQQKHGISFKEAVSVFRDDFSITLEDTTHSVEEERYIDIGLSANGNILVVVYTERGNDIRIISCRKASLLERKAYEKQNS